MKRDKMKIFFKKTNYELEKFFDINIKQPKIIFYNSRKEIDKKHKKKTPDWLVGWVKNGDIHILSYEKFIEESSHKNREKFWKTIKHELAHLYFKEKIKDFRPLWLNEGLACYLAKQNKKPNFKGVKSLKFYFEKNNPYIYNFGFFIVLNIIDVYGKEKFKLFLDKWTKSKKTYNNFNRLFKEYFNISVFAFWKKIKNQTT